MTVVCANNAADNILIVGRPCDLWLDSVTLTVTQLTKKNEQLEQGKQEEDWDRMEEEEYFILTVWKTMSPLNFICLCVYMCVCLSVCLSRFYCGSDFDKTW